MVRNIGFCLACISVVGLSLAAQPANAFEMGWAGFGIRFGYKKINLKAAKVPYAGDKLKEAFDNVNEKVDEYNQTNGTSQPHYLMKDLNLNTGMLQIIPSFHLGGDGYFTKLELPIGLSSEFKTIGFGCYPINYGWTIDEFNLFPYLSVGFALSYAYSKKFEPTSGSTVNVNAKGGLIETRAAVGIKYFGVDNWPISIEIGYSPYALGLVFDNNQKLRIDSTNVLDALPDNPGSIARGGAGWLLSALVGVDWL
ncbi:MAG: hypothetical protein JW841_10790 [Deltaproteobacteria bacterium]|nr:hypothetical protein [Deltaproteobacteria bacterium]